MNAADSSLKPWVFGESPVNGLLSWPEFKITARGACQSGNAVFIAAVELLSDSDLIRDYAYDVADKALEKAAHLLMHLTSEFFSGATQIEITGYSRDMFLVMVSGGPLAAGASRFREALKAALPSTHTHLVSPMEFAVGSALYPESGSSADHAIRAAIKSLKQPDGAALTSCPTALELREALSSKQLELWHQPKVDLATRKVVGAEALLRWRHPDHGLLMPMVFIPWFVECRLLAELDEYVVRNALNQAETLRRQGIVRRISINLSRAILLKGSLHQIVREYDVVPALVEFEITEHVLCDTPRCCIIRQLEALRHAGFSVSLDDFGTGFNNLSALSSLPVDCIKLDRSFLLDAERRQDDRVIRTIVNIAHTLECRVVAEGIETEDQARLATDTGCQIGQGFYFGRAVPANTLYGCSHLT